MSESAKKKETENKMSKMVNEKSDKEKSKSSIFRNKKKI